MNIYVNVNILDEMILDILLVLLGLLLDVLVLSVVSFVELDEFVDNILSNCPEASVNISFFKHALST